MQWWRQDCHATAMSGDWYVGALDSHEDDVPEACRCGYSRGIDGSVAAANRALWLLATHHPLLQIGAPWLDKDRIEAPEKLLDELIDAEGPAFCGAIFGQRIRSSTAAIGEDHC